MIYSDMTNLSNNKLNIKYYNNNLKLLYSNITN